MLHSFGEGTDGIYPAAALIFDAEGNLYGTTNLGGIHPCQGAGCGTVFELSPREDGGWTEKVLHSFGRGTDGNYPQAGLIMDAAGNLYGTTLYGGYNPCPWGGGCGTVFELSPREDGGWTERVLHNFNYNAYSEFGGAYPKAGLIFDAAGNLYSTTSGGGGYICQGSGCGTVFELSPTEGGGWAEKDLRDFCSCGEGTNPVAGLIMDTAGNLYGTVGEGGMGGGGAAFELTLQADGSWSETNVYYFSYDHGGGPDGAYPNASLIFDAAGNLYSTTKQGGVHDTGTVFELTPTDGGTWSEKVLHSFGDGTDGFYPLANLILDAGGNLYSTTSAGGIHGDGAVFEIMH